jgi:hypothetical protein
MEWINTEDKLPDDGEVLCYTTANSHRVVDGSYVRHLVNEAKREGEQSYFTHWRPLPESPRQ